MDIKIGYVGQKTDKEITYSYTLFNGKESTSLYLEENQTLSLVVEAKIQKGKLNLILKDPQNNIILNTELENGDLTPDITVNQTGYYRLILEGSWTSGIYAASWDVT